MICFNDYEYTKKRRKKPQKHLELLIYQRSIKKTSIHFWLCVCVLDVIIVVEPFSHLPLHQRYSSFSSSICRLLLYVDLICIALHVYVCGDYFCLCSFCGFNYYARLLFLAVRCTGLFVRLAIVFMVTECRPLCVEWNDGLNSKVKDQTNDERRTPTTPQENKKKITKKKIDIVFPMRSYSFRMLSLGFFFPTVSLFILVIQR